MNLSLLYFSATDTTKKIVKAIAKNLTDEYREYDITMKNLRKKEEPFKKDELLIVGLPVYGGRIPAFLEDCLRKLKGNETPVFLTAVYGNRHYDDALLEMKDIFTGNGFKVIGAGAFIGEHSFTSNVAEKRPDKTDLNIAEKLGSKIKEKLLTGSNEGVIIPGSYPYRERKPSTSLAPITDSFCINCSLCAKLCPQEAIDFKDPSKADAGKCIKCNKCIKSCPMDAKRFEGEEIKKIIRFLEDNCGGVRKEPEIFI